MKKQWVVAVLDMVAGMYMTPFFAPSEAYALRSFRTAAEELGHQFNSHPADYAIYHIGFYDAETGEIEGAIPRKLAVASQFVLEEV